MDKPNQNSPIEETYEETYEELTEKGKKEKEITEKLREKERLAKAREEKKIIDREDAERKAKEYWESKRPSQFLNEDINSDNVFNIKHQSHEYEISNEYLERYKGLPIPVIKDIELFTQFRNILLTDKQAYADATELERHRRLPKGCLSKRGIVYSEGIQIINQFPLLRETSFLYLVNNLLEGRYLYPITLPNGDVYTFMGYDPQDKLNKYQIAKVSEIKEENWIKQGNILANLDSIKRYPNSKEVLVVEGFFDAVHAEERYKMPVVATLGANLNQNKRDILWQVKTEYNVDYVIVPDYDKAGTSDKRLKNQLWEDVFFFNSGKNKEELVKDIDEYLIITPDEELLTWDTLANKTRRE